MSSGVWPEPLSSPPAAEITFDGHEGAYAHTFDGNQLTISNSATQELYDVAYSAFQLSEHMVLFRFVKPDSAHLVAVDVVTDLSEGSAFSVHQFVPTREPARAQLYVERGSIGSRFRIESMVAFAGWEHTPSRLQMHPDESPNTIETEELDRRGRLRVGSGRALDLGGGIIALLRRGTVRSSFILVNLELNRYTATHLTADVPTISPETGVVVLSTR